MRLEFVGLSWTKQPATMKWKRVNECDWEEAEAIVETPSNKVVLRALEVVEEGRTSPGY